MSQGEAWPPSGALAVGGLSWTRVRTPRWLSRVAKTLFVAAQLGVVAGWLDLYGVAIGARMLGWLAYGLFLLSYIVSLTQTTFEGALEVSPWELIVTSRGGRRRSIPRVMVRSAIVVERELFGAVVASAEIELTSGDVLTARFAEASASRAVVEALGFGAGGARVHVALATPQRRILHVLLGAGAYAAAKTALLMAIPLLPESTTPWWDLLLSAAHPLAALAVYGVLRRLLRAPEITVGDDGVLVEARFGRRFVPRSEIALATGPDGTLSVTDRRTGEHILRRGAALDDARAAAVTRVIAQRATPAAHADRLGPYERGGRALAAWREHLARAMGETSYRENAVTVGEAAAALRSPLATPEQRVGAALALRIAGEPVERIRIAADATVDDGTREALEAVAETQDDVVIEKALRRMN